MLQREKMKKHSLMAVFVFRVGLMLVAGTAKEGKKERKEVSKKDGRQKSNQISTLLWLQFFRHVRHLDHSVHFF
jgi:hypothetical protein